VGETTHSIYEIEVYNRLIVILVIHTKLDVTKEGARFVSIRIQHFVKRARTDEHPSCLGVSGNHMNRDQEIKDIVNQLERPQIQQSNLVQRLGLLSDGDNVNNSTNRQRQTTPVREFAISDKVRISNPGRFQPVRGTIIKIGRSRITVEARDGTKIVRAPMNLVFEE
jgi:hypothetical protein